MLHLRQTRIRGLTFYRAHHHRSWHSPDPPPDDGPDPEAVVHARSRFQSVDDPDLFAEYAVQDVGAPPAMEATTARHHTLIVVREFRRVPLDASVLALAIFRARGGHAAQAIAALGHWSERAVSLAEPAYLLVAHSLEEPRMLALLTGIDECRALAGARGSAFSVQSLLADAGQLLTAEPEWYSYCAPREEESSLLVSPSAV